jgi:preprotein translocase subunit SecG
VLIQKPDGDGLSGLGGSSSSATSMFSSRAKANILTRTTAILGIGFFLTSLTLAYIATHSRSGSIVDRVMESKENPSVPTVPTAGTQPEKTQPEPLENKSVKPKEASKQDMKVDAENPIKDDKKDSPQAKPSVPTAE